MADAAMRDPGRGGGDLRRGGSSACASSTLVGEQFTLFLTTGHRIKERDGDTLTFRTLIFICKNGNKQQRVKI